MDVVKPWQVGFVGPLLCEILCVPLRLRGAVRQLRHPGLRFLGALQWSRSEAPAGVWCLSSVLAEDAQTCQLPRQAPTSSAARTRSSRALNLGTSRSESNEGSTFMKIANSDWSSNSFSR